jgi:uncharacterized protein (DUF3820 family)
MRGGGAMTDPDPKIIPFGKYKGRLVDEVLVDDPAYLQWLAGQDWFRAKFNILHQVIINRGAEPEETPDHNAMQVKFLDDEFCVRFINHYASGDVRASLQNALSTRAESVQKNIKELKSSLEYHLRYWADDQPRITNIKQQIAKAEQLFAQQLNQRIGQIEFKIQRSFEERGVDVLLQVRAISKSPDIEVEPYNLYPDRDNGAYFHRGISIEIKPIIGDDYPAVLRQMKANGSNVLFVGEYRGQGATQEQFIKTMATAQIRVVFARDVDAAEG